MSIHKARGRDVRHKSIAALLPVACLTVVLAAAMASAQSRGEVAVTIDDAPQNGREFGLERMQRMTEHLVRALSSRRVPAVVFVNEAQLFTRPGEVDARIALLDAWASAGIELGNHTYAHKRFRDVTLAQFEEEVVRGETITKLVAERHKLPYRYFRHPYLNTGPDLETRTAFERFLAGRGYTIAPATVDASDWMFALVYGDAKTRGDKAMMRRVADEYLAFADAALSYSEAYARGLFGRPIRHILVMHANELNAEHFDELAEVFERRGYGFVSLGRALEDEAYSSPNTFAGDEGILWLERWAATRGAAVGLTRPEPPAWVWEAYQRIDAESPPRIPGSRN
jgi:peptidoglycan/xylan/chitin deacetylase (PgdA/CDA1 family)